MSLCEKRNEVLDIVQGKSSTIFRGLNLIKNFEPFYGNIIIFLYFQYPVVECETASATFFVN